MNTDIIKFELAGMSLQEPMALVTNWMMSGFCLYAFLKLRRAKSVELIWWKRFFLVFTISSFFGGTGHLFFQYHGIPGKFPNWITGVISGYCAGRAILTHFTESITKKSLHLFLIVKAIVLLSLAIVSKKFIFVAVDAIITYVLFCGIIGYYLSKKGLLELKFLYYGVIICLPSVFIFLLKLSPHRWLNKDDLSHLLMLGCLYCFYLAGSKRMQLKSNS